MIVTAARLETVCDVIDGLLATANVDGRVTQGGFDADATTVVIEIDGNMRGVPDFVALVGRDNVLVCDSLLLVDWPLV